MTSNWRRHVKPLQVKYWSQRNHLKLLTENSMTRQGHDLFGQFPNPHCSCVWYVSVSCSISCSCFTWMCHHRSAFARIKGTVVLMWLLPAWPFLLLLYSCLPHYSLSWPLQGEKDQQLKSTDTLSSTMYPHQDTHSFPVGGWFIHCTVCPRQLCLSPFTLCLC